MSNIVLGITGSIAAYKSYDIAKELVRLGHQVVVVLTRGSLHFIKPQLFTYLGVQKVYQHDDDFNQPGVLHIDLARWCDKLVICPLSANTLARLSYGQADDLLSSIFLSLKDKPCLLFPAMNTSMLNNPLTQINVTRLKSLPLLHMFPPQEGLLACGEVGSGKLAPIEYVVALIDAYNLSNTKSKKVLITTGATLSHLDPIRYLTNGSTGVMGKILAQSFLRLGFNVQVIATTTSSDELNYFKDLPNYELIRVSSAEEMLDKVSERFDQCDLFIAAAAVNDLTFKKSAQKLKKASLPKSLEVTPNPDILSAMLKRKQKHQRVVGFAGEHPCNEVLLQEKWEKKPVDLLIGNQIETALATSQSSGYGHSTNEYWFLENGKLKERKTLDKNNLASYVTTWYSTHAQ